MVTTMSKPRLYEWYKRFSEDRESVEDDGRSVRPKTSINEGNVEKVQQMILKDQQITIREVADYYGISFASCHAIFTDVLVIIRVAAKFIPKLLNQKQHRVDISEEMLNKANNDPELMNYIITGEETWVYGYDV
ncbi:protein GVQW3-like [Belonocnema kinseyi]|uniref:protein GVQW3-like n=1 Tax=Belonocnema kinseyi TaxID=2817044 RepID=UPI00143DBB7A|nr:protein GVQW3-like [Belonocnema kinseyi]